MEGRRPGPSLLTGRRQVTQWAEFSPQLNSKSEASSMSYFLTHFARSASVVVSIISVSRAVCRSDDWSDMSREPRSFIEQPTPLSPERLFSSHCCTYVQSFALYNIL